VLKRVAKLPAGPGHSFVPLPSEIAMNAPERSTVSGRFPLPSKTSTRDSGKALGD
jgi:hypothetical protein